MKDPTNADELAKHGTSRTLTEMKEKICILCKSNGQPLSRQQMAVIDEFICDFVRNRLAVIFAKMGRVSEESIQLEILKALE